MERGKGGEGRTALCAPHAVSLEERLHGSHDIEGVRPDLVDGHVANALGVLGAALLVLFRLPDDDVVLLVILLFLDLL